MSILLCKTATKHLKASIFLKHVLELLKRRTVTRYTFSYRASKLLKFKVKISKKDSFYQLNLEVEIYHF